MSRPIFDDSHEAFRSVVRDFLAREATPKADAWERAGTVDRDFLLRAGELGLLGMQAPSEYGGGGTSSFKYNAVVCEEIAKAHIALGSIRVHADIVLPYFLGLSTPAQRDRWLKNLTSGRAMSAIAMSEPGAGSDLAGISTRAVPEGDGFVLNGSKSFITNGRIADLVIVVVRTEMTDNRREGLSLLVVENGMPGFVRGRSLDKIGLKSQDTTDLFFDNVSVPRDNLLGTEGRAFEHLTANLPQERLSIAVHSVAAARSAMEETIRYVKQRHAFGRPIASFQNTKFEIASVATEIEAAQHLVDASVEQHDRRELTPAKAAMAKLFSTEVQGRTMDRCLQLFGGYGYTTEFPIAKMYADARVSRIYGGTSEVMKSIISKSVGL
ncbi:MAG: acyl-CoA dehydrogenase [Actinophytocola sp.]|uniref:acyl-CoA dehydrogenase family protein n=1 Tax=Actinophytocola sp. TaxID=1872138 RepID=UPI00132C5AEC|nr:acyl-CoA dehydrogenase family protein [Actinophytocola sp.]MPZ80079.1 acyl-CoA dehydrogenase [Actinophytocola sp.]